MKNSEKKNIRGITLIALIITIIILLILAGISIQALTNTGLFGKAKIADTETRGASVQEAKDLWKMNQELDNYGENATARTLEELLNDLEKQKLITADERTTIEETGEVTIGSRTIVFKVNILADYVEPGDYVAYTPDTASTDSILEELGTYSGSTENTTSTLTQESLNWRVLDIVDGKVRLISEVPTTSKIALYGYNGYNNAVYLLDKTCSTLYNNSTYAESVQNLKIEDIQKYTNVTDYSTIDSGYGSTYSPYTTYYPSILMQEKDQTVTASDGTEQPTTRLDLSEQITPINQTAMSATSWTLKDTSWYKTMAEIDFTNSIYYNLFINNGSNYSDYWMSSRCVSVDIKYARFLVSNVNTGIVNNTFALFNSDYNSKSYARALRPIITLKSDVQIDTIDATKDGTTATNAYVLK